MLHRCHGLALTAVLLSACGATAEPQATQGSAPPSAASAEPTPAAERAARVLVVSLDDQGIFLVTDPGRVTPEPLKEPENYYFEEEFAAVSNSGRYVAVLAEPLASPETPAEARSTYLRIEVASGQQTPFACNCERPAFVGDTLLSHVNDDDDPALGERQSLNLAVLREGADQVVFVPAEIPIGTEDAVATAAGLLLTVETNRGSELFLLRIDGSVTQLADTDNTGRLQATFDAAGTSAVLITSSEVGVITELLDVASGEKQRVALPPTAAGQLWAVEAVPNRVGDPLLLGFPTSPACEDDDSCVMPASLAEYSVLELTSAGWGVKSAPLDVTDLCGPGFSASIFEFGAGGGAYTKELQFNGATLAADEEVYFVCGGRA